MKSAAKKLLLLAGTLLIVSFLAFLAFSVIPGDPTTKLLGTQATPERVKALREELGLNAPLLLRYGRWLAGFVTGDMGVSYSYSLPVGELVFAKMPTTFALTALSFLMIVAVSIPLGILSARYEGGPVDRTLTVLGQLFMAVPPFFVGILLTYLFGLLLHWFTPGKFVAYSENPAAFWEYLLFPAIAVALPRIAMAVRLLRSTLLREEHRDYVRTAVSRGNGENSVLWRHVLLNAIVPVVTFLAMTLADIVAGSIIIEQLFSIPGLGRLLLASISNRDFPVVQAIIVILAFWVVLCNSAADAINRRIDPRLRLR